MNAEGASGTTSRLFFVDHLRGTLAVLVVLHHVALVYGAAAPFYYVEPPGNDPLAFVALLVFALVNQSWFMGAFFLLAGYFTPASFDRRGPARYLKDRLLRFGIPLVIFFFVLNPVASIGIYQMPASLTGITTPLTWKAYPTLLGMGPMWFVAMLLIFTSGYVAWRMLSRNRTSTSRSNSVLPGYLSIGVFILALAVVSYFVRFVIPIGRSLFGFPTLAYLPQYLSFFAVGVFASRYNWFQVLPNSMGVAGLATAVVGGVILFPLAFSGRVLSLAISPALANAMGRGKWQSAVYALWDSAFAVGLCLALITLFRQCFKKDTRFSRFMSQQSYAVYFIHIPILVFVALALKHIELEPLLKFGVAALITVPFCFGIAYLLRRIPLASRVL